MSRITRKVQFVSQKHTRYSEIGCGVAAILMLLKASGHPIPKTFIEMGRLLKVDVEPKEKWNDKYCDFGLGAYARDVSDYLNDELINHISINDSGKTELSWNILIDIATKYPVMIGMYNINETTEWGEGGHWIVITKTGGGFQYYDPYCKMNEKHMFNIEKSKLKNDWDGYAVAIT